MTLHNNVVMGVCYSLFIAGIASLRFNFRGVGRSQGQYDEGRGEMDDVLAALAAAGSQESIATDRVGLAGYSFGAGVAMKTAQRGDVTTALSLIGRARVDDEDDFSKIHLPAHPVHHRRQGPAHARMSSSPTCRPGSRCHRRCTSYPEPTTSSWARSGRPQSICDSLLPALAFAHRLAMRQQSIGFRSGKLTLEGIVTIPQGVTGGSPGVVVCHAHPVLGGNMTSDVMHAICRSLDAAGIATFRFNFRGVGSSEGDFDQGKGEQNDLKSAFDTFRKWPGRQERTAWAWPGSLSARLWPWTSSRSTKARRPSQWSRRRWRP